MLNKVPQFEGLNVTFNTTEDCNIRCTYCYEINKRPVNLKLQSAKKFIDLILTDPDPIGVMGTDDEWMLNNGLVLDFIGGDALMNVSIVDEILKYFIYKSTMMNHKWANNWKASISTNGTLFVYENVRDFVKKYSKNLSLGISIDGSPAIHDKYRVYRDGTGTMSTIREWLPWYREVFNNNETSRSTKATCSKESIKYLYESLVFMHKELGINFINQNFIYEDMGLEPQDLEILESELQKCIKYVFDNRDSLYWSMIDKEKFAMAHPMRDEDRDTGVCGSGNMPALGIDGKIYSCFRWLPHTQNGADLSVGSVGEGFIRKYNFEKIRNGAKRGYISSSKCLECPVESACSYCIAGCYAEFNDFKRQEYICEITKLQVKYARLYQDMLKEVENG